MSQKIKEILEKQSALIAKQKTLILKLNDELRKRNLKSEEISLVLQGVTLGLKNASNIAFLTEIEEVTKTIDPGSTFDWYEFEQQIQINKQPQVHTASITTITHHAHASLNSIVPSNTCPPSKSHPILQQQKPTESSKSPESIPKMLTQTTSMTPTLEDFEMNLGENEPEEVVKMEVAEENDESIEEIEEIGFEDNFLEGPSSSSSGTSGIPVSVFNVGTKTESADLSQISNPGTLPHNQNLAKIPNFGRIKLVAAQIVNQNMSENHVGSRRNKPKAIPMAWKKNYAKIFREKGYTNEARLEVLELYKADFKNKYGHEPDDEAHTNCMIRLCNKNRDAILMDGAAFRNFGHKLKTTKDKSPNSWSFENAIGRKIFADYGPEMDVKWQLVQSIGKILQRDKFATVDEISKLKLSRNFCLRLLAEQKLLLKDNLEIQNQDEFFI